VGVVNTSAKLAAYGAGLAAIFAASFGIGGAVGPIGLSNAQPPASHTSMAADGEGLPGLSAVSGELSLDAATDTLPAGEPVPYSFTIRDGGGAVTEFELEHTKRMHLIVVRRDFVGFVHTHPVMAAGGTWSTTLTLDEPGAYRVFADFVVGGDKHVLGTDLFVPGDFQPVRLPTVSTVADAGAGYEVALAGDVIAGEESTLEFTVRRNGEIVADLPDYLGAKGHLVAVRDGDLAYLHVHPDADRLVFDAEFPSAGSYRLFLQFDTGGTIRTAEFTITAREATS
jgi:hypothetical protein